MSRGLSQQQLQILGLAVAVSRFRYGCPRAFEPRAVSGWRVPVVEGQPYDVHGVLAAHVLGGVRWLPDNFMGSTHSTIHFDKTPAARSVRYSMNRAIAGLGKRGLLAYGFAKATSPWGMDNGEVMTTAGLTAGLKYELRVADLERRLWLLRPPCYKQVRESWNVYEPLDPPGFSLRADRPDDPDVVYSGSMKPRIAGADVDGSYSDRVWPPPSAAA